MTQLESAKLSHRRAMKHKWCLFHSNKVHTHAKTKHGLPGEDDPGRSQDWPRGRWCCEEWREGSEGREGGVLMPGQIAKAKGICLNVSDGVTEAATWRSERAGPAGSDPLLSRQRTEAEPGRLMSSAVKLNEKKACKRGQFCILKCHGFMLLAFSNTRMWDWVYKISQVWEK